MSLESAYAKVGGNIDEVRARFRDDARIMKYMKMFLKDDAFAKLDEACAGGDIASAFRFAHTLKGTSRDMALNQLADVASTLAEQFRPSPDGDYPTVEPSDYAENLEAVREAYSKVLAAFTLEGMI